MIELPVCRWRKEQTIEGWHKCSSPKLMHGPNGVRDDLCQGCYVRDHESESVERQETSYIQLLANFAYAMKTELEWRAKGGAAPTEEEKAERRRQCDACPERDEKTDSCKLCSCYLEAGLLPPRPLGKLGASSQSCPFNPPKWGYTGGYVPPATGGCCGKKT